MRRQAKFFDELRRQSHAVITHGLTIAEMASPNYTEYWHNVGDSGEVDFANGWQNYSFGALDMNMNPLGYRRDNSGFTHIRGMVEAIPATDNVIFTLPAGWRPPYLTTIPVIWGAEATDNYPLNNDKSEAFIHANGDVEITRAKGRSIDYISFDTIKFRAY